MVVYSAIVTWRLCTGSSQMMFILQTRPEKWFAQETCSYQKLFLPQVQSGRQQLLTSLSRKYLGRIQSLDIDFIGVGIFDAEGRRH